MDKQACFVVVVILFSNHCFVSMPCLFSCFLFSAQSVEREREKKREKKKQVTDCSDVIFRFKKRKLLTVIMIMLCSSNWGYMWTTKANKQCYRHRQTGRHTQRQTWSKFLFQNKQTRQNACTWTILKRACFSPAEFRAVHWRRSSQFQSARSSHAWKHRNLPVPFLRTNVLSFTTGAGQ